MAWRYSVTSLSPSTSWTPSQRSMVVMAPIVGSFVRAGSSPARTPSRRSPTEQPNICCTSVSNRLPASRARSGRRLHHGSPVTMTPRPVHRCRGAVDHPDEAPSSRPPAAVTVPSFDPQCSSNPQSQPMPSTGPQATECLMRSTRPTTTPQQPRRALPDPTTANSVDRGTRGSLIVHTAWTITRSRIRRSGGLTGSLQQR